MSKHTPGPWKRAGRRIVGPDGKSVCAVASTVRRSADEKLANLMLLAAAPDLLQALNEAVDHELHKGNYVPPAWVVMAKRAMAKVEGRA